jgi:predicted nuclease of predicted toxin-antitoxin system
MGTLSSELAPLVADAASEPRVYADANIPTGIVAFMRAELRWNVLYVLEHEDLRRARDIEHYRLARQLGRTLVTQDRDYIDDEGFPPGEGAGVIVLSAPDEPRLRLLLADVDQAVFRAEGAGPLPLAGRKVLKQVGD